MTVRARPTGRAHRLLAGALAAGMLVPALLTGCAQSVDPIERLSRKAAQKVGPHTRRPTAETYHRWGISRPLAPAPRPPARSVLGSGGARDTGGSGRSGRRTRTALPPVVDHVPTRDKVVFLTFDDGAEKDTRFVGMVRDLRLPVSLFLTDTVAGPGYVQFARLRAVGASVQNHTLDHPYLPSLPYAGQRAEICGQRDKLKARFGLSPRLFRPPYGKYDADTLRAAADCGVAAVVLWRASLRGDGLRYGDHAGGRLRRGDIILAHVGGPDGLRGPSLTAATTRVLRRVEEQGFTVGRLEDYL